jgi:O-antigen/teichoic acid export membrane protein
MGIFHRIKSAEIVKVSFYSGISTALKILTSFVSAKIIAVYLGPAGLGMLGQLTSFITIFLTLSTGAITNGVIKFIAEYKEEEHKQNRIIKASIQITLLCSLLCGLIISIGAKFWSNQLFSETSYSFVFVIFGITIIFYALFSLAIAILNGLQQYKLFNLINVLASIIGLAFSVSMVVLYGINGALISAVTYQSVVFVLLLWFIKRTGWLNWQKVKSSIIQRSDLIGLSKFSLMAIVSTAAVPLVQIIIRNYLASNTNAETVGFYEGVNRLSLIYLSLITTTFSVYYLPKLSAANNNSELKELLIKGYKFILPLTFAMLLVTYLLRNLVIKIVFADSFAPMESYFLPQLIGDFFKIASWLLAMQMIAKARTWLFISTELIFGVFLVFFTFALVKQYGGIGAVYAYTVNYFIYLVAMFFIFKNTLINEIN